MDKLELEQWFAYDQNTGALSRRKKPVKGPGNIGDVVGSRERQGYLVVSLLGKRYKVHRIIACILLGIDLYDLSVDIDHINGDRTDNRLCNLRVVPRRINMRNMKCHRQGHPAGCTYNAQYNFWTVQITVKNIWHNLGSYKTLAEAEKVSVAAAIAADADMFEQFKQTLALKPHRNRGTSFYKAGNKWAAFIIINGRKKHLGYYETEQEAHEAHLKASQVQ